MIKKYKDYQYQLPAYNPLADSDWISTQSGLPWLPLTLLVPHEIILTEIKNIESLLLVHREEYNEHQGWKSFCIHGKAYDATREDEYYNDDRSYQWTPEAEKLMPKTVEYFKTQWPGDQYHRIRVMLLEPGGYISIHSDNGSPGLNPINIAITQPTDCDFVIEEKGSVPFAPGRAIWLDVNQRHTVFNHSNEPRWHIIVHQNIKNQKFQIEVVNSYKIMYNNYNENRNNHNTR